MDDAPLFCLECIYPIAIMPAWLRVIARLNPLTYIVDALRGLILTGDLSRLCLDFTVLVFSVTIIASIGAKRFHKVVV